MAQNRPSSFRLAFESLEATAKSLAPVLARNWLQLVPLHLAQALSTQFFAYATDYIRMTGREDVGFIALIAVTELVFTLAWSAAWVLCVVRAAEATISGRRAPKLMDSMVRYFNPLLIEQVRSMAAILWRIPMLILPGLMQYFRLALVPFVVIFDPGYEIGSTDALARSRELSRGRFWLLFATVLGSLLVPWFLDEAVRGDQGPWIWENPLGVGIGWVLTLFINTAATIFLFFIFRGLSAPQASKAASS